MTVVAAAGLVAGCGIGGGFGLGGRAATGVATGTGPAARLQRVNLVWTSFDEGTLPTWAASEQGYFRQQGLDVHLSFIPDNLSALAALASGRIAVLDGSPVAAAAAALRGEDTVVLAVDVPFDDQRVMAMPGVDGVHALAGQTVGLTEAGDWRNRLFVEFLRRYGLDVTPLARGAGGGPALGNDTGAGGGPAPGGATVRLAYLGSLDAQLAALRRGFVQAIVVSPPGDADARELGAHEVIDLMQQHLPYPIDGLITTRRFADSHPQLVEAVMVAYLEGLRFVRTDPAGAEQVYARFSHQSDPQVLSDVYRALLAALPSEPWPDTASMRAAVTLAGGHSSEVTRLIDPQPLLDALQNTP